MRAADQYLRVPLQLASASSADHHGISRDLQAVLQVAWRAVAVALGRTQAPLSRPMDAVSALAAGTAVVQPHVHGQC